MAAKSEKRRREILGIINTEGIAYVNELAKMFRVTSETIRSDFDYLSGQYELKRIHGGIRKEKTEIHSQHYRYQDSKLINVEEKKRICYRAMSLIENGNCLYVDGGSTLSYILNFLNEKEDITIVTPSVAILMKYIMEGFDRMFDKNRNRLVFAGGDVNASILTSYGTFFDQVIQDFYFDKMLFSVDAVDIKGGCTDSDEIAFSIIKKVAAQSHVKMVLADSSKFGYITSYKAMDWNRVDYLVTEKELDNGWREYLKRHFVEYVQA